MQEEIDRARRLEEKFRRMFGETPRVFRAPGRVNIIGEHTDYNDGFVLPAAIDLFTRVAIRPRADTRIHAYSENFKQAEEIGAASGPKEGQAPWSRYISAVAQVLSEAGCRLRGANLLVEGEIPMGAGVSSSAALEVAAGSALLANSGIEIDRLQLAQLCQRAENEIVGTRCGIMDQLASACSAKDHAILLDCRSLARRTLLLPPQIRLVILNSMVKRELAATAYNIRRAECEEGAKILSRRLPGKAALRDVSLEELEGCQGLLPENVYRRCRHVVTENERVLRAAAALEQDHLAELGRLMADSHRSLREDFAVSCAELDLLVELANEVEGLHGARLTGAGFGGCTINLVDAVKVEAFQERVSGKYRERTGLTPDCYVCRAANGVEEVL